MKRFRLRFLLQEIDLRSGSTIIGRSPSCHITIEDPLVSRRHTSLTVMSGRAQLEDLGSRNGSFVNGVRVDGPTPLAAGDRIRIGTLELVFCVVAGSEGDRGSVRRDTGSMCRCAECGSPYPLESGACPICGSLSHLDEDTMSGLHDSTDGWSLELVGSVLEKACELERWQDVERLVERARPTVERVIAAGEPLERRHLDAVAVAALRLAVARGSGEGARWVLAIHATQGLVPCEACVKALEGLPAGVVGELEEVVQRLVRQVLANGGPGSDERGRFDRVETLPAKR